MAETHDTPPQPEEHATGLIRYVPNALTIFRLACLPVFWWLYGLQAPGFAWYAALVMWVAAWSDVADGYIARRYHATSEFGGMMDPLVDRAFFLTVFAAYIYYGTMPWWAAAPVLLRDLVIILAAVLFFGSTKERPRVMKLGKWANFVLAWSVGFFMIGVQVVAWPIYIVGATMYVVSGALYFVRFARERRQPPTGEQSPGGGPPPTGGQPPTDGQPPTTGSPPGGGQPPTDGQPPTTGSPPTDGQPPGGGQSPTDGSPPSDGPPPTIGPPPAGDQPPTDEQSPTDDQSRTGDQPPADGATDA